MATLLLTSKCFHKLAIVKSNIISNESYGREPGPPKASAGGKSGKEKLGKKRILFHFYSLHFVEEYISH